MLNLTNKIALVTGAGSGIGRAVAELYAKQGAKVIVSDIVEDGGKETVEAIKQAGGDAYFIQADTAKPEDHERLIKETIAHYGALHIACNNAGIGGAAARTGEYGIEDWNKVIAINLSGVFYGMRYQIPAMLQSGGGAIVNIASILGKVGAAGSSAYVASKHGVIGLTEAAALEYAKDGIRINAVGPGYIETPLLSKHLNEEQLKVLVNLHPIGRLGLAEEVANQVLWLSADEASFVTGAYHNVDGGYLAQ